MCGVFSGKSLCSRSVSMLIDQTANNNIINHVEHIQLNVILKLLFTIARPRITIITANQLLRAPSSNSATSTTVIPLSIHTSDTLIRATGRTWEPSTTIWSRLSSTMRSQTAVPIMPNAGGRRSVVHRAKTGSSPLHMPSFVKTGGDEIA